MDALEKAGFPLVPLPSKRISRKWGDGDHGATSFVGAGIPFIQAGHLSELVANFPGGNPVFISPEKHAGLKRSQLQPNDLLVVKKGSIGYVSIMPQAIPAANTSAEVAFFRCTKELDSGFGAAFLKSAYGQASLLRLAAKSTRPTLGLNELEEVRVPLPAADTQRYIGDKVRQAEWLRNHADFCWSEANALLEACLSWSPRLGGSRRFRRLRPYEMQDRLDGNFNSPARLQLVEHLSTNHVELNLLAELADTSAMIGWKGLTTEHYKATGPWLLRGVEITNGVIDFDALVSVALDKYQEQPQIHLQKGDVALSKDGTIGKAAVIPELPQAMAVGSTVARLRLRSPKAINPYYLEFALNHEALQIQIRSFATGMAQPHITQEWIERLQVPRCAEEGKIAELVRRHHHATALAKDLTLTARFLVEGLIDGRVIESDLIAVHKDVERRDFQSERSLLKRMSRKGMDTPGVPAMFPSLDALYQILDDTQSSVNKETK